MGPTKSVPSTKLFGLMASATPLPSFVSHQDFLLFYKIDRELYKILVVSLYRDPTESMEVLAMWLWLERVGYRKLVQKITTLPSILINEVAEETVTCLNYVKSSHFSFFAHMPLFPSECTDIPTLQSIVEKEISVSLLYDNRVVAFQGITNMVRDVCIRAFTDIMHQAISRNKSKKMVEAQKKMVKQRLEPHFLFGSVGASHLQRVGMTVGGNTDQQLRVMHNYLTQDNTAIPADERTLFLIFSKGHRVEEREVMEFFTMAFEDCVEALYMQEVPPNEQALFARIVFRNKSTIGMILKGSSKAKFAINGKHVWAREFVPKRTWTSLPITTYTNFTGESSGTGI